MKKILVIDDEEWLRDMVKLAARTDLLYDDSALLRGLEEIHRDYPGVTRNPRGKGLFCAMDLASPELRSAVISKAQELGMIILATGHQGLRFRPALNLATEDLDLGVDLLRESIKLAVAALSPTQLGA